MQQAAHKNAMATTSGLGLLKEHVPKLDPQLTLVDNNGRTAKGAPAKVRVRMAPQGQSMLFSFLSLTHAKAALSDPAFLSAATWKALPLIPDGDIDHAVDLFVRPGDLYHAVRTFNQQADHRLREAGVFCISNERLH